MNIENEHLRKMENLYQKETEMDNYFHGKIKKKQNLRSTEDINTITLNF